MSESLELANNALPLGFLFFLVNPITIILASVIPIRVQIHLRLAYKVCPLDKLPRKEHDDHDRNFNVIRHKIDALEIRTETFPALYQHEHDVETDSNDRAEGVSPILEGKQMLQALGANRAPEAQRSNTNANPRQLV